MAGMESRYQAALGPMPGSLLGLAQGTQNFYLYFISYNGVEIAFMAMLAAVAAYVAVSRLTCREDFNMERMLHRGAYTLAGEETPDGEQGEDHVEPDHWL